MQVETKQKQDAARRVERELQYVIRKLQRWSKEIETHHIEIARRNFAIGLEISGFIDSFPPRSYPGMDLMGRISESVKLSPSYLSLLARVSNWLYRDLKVRSIGTYMHDNDVFNWSGVVEKYFVAQGRSESEILLGKRWIGAKASLQNLRSALPKKDRGIVDAALEKLEEVVLAKLD